MTGGRRLDTVYYEVIVGGTDIDDNNRENLFSDYNFDWGNKFYSTNNYCDMAEIVGLNKKQNKKKEKVTKILEEEVEMEEEENGDGNNSDSTLELQRKLRESFGVQVGSGENNQKKVNEQLKQLAKDMRSEGDKKKKKPKPKSIETNKKKNKEKKVTESPQKNKRDRPRKSGSNARMPTGWSFRLYIPTRGQKPRCQGCGRIINYSDYCVRYSFYEKSHYENPTRNQYHCYASCLQQMSAEHLDSFIEKYWIEPEVIEVKNEIIKMKKKNT